MITNIRFLATCLFLLIAAPSNIFASDLSYVIEVGASNSDNVTRVEEDPVEDTYALAALDLNYEQESRKVETNITTDLEYRNYEDDTFEDEVVGALDGQILLKFVPEVFSWEIRDVFGNLQSNPFQPNSPGNRENVNRFETGPDLRIGLGSVSALELGARYNITRYEESNIDNDTLSGRVSFVRRLSPHRALSLNVTGDDVEFEDTILNRDFTRYAAYVGFASEISRGTLIVNVGYNELREDDEVADGNLVNVEFTRSFSPTFTFTLGYYQGLSDASDQIGGLQESEQGFGSTYDAAGVADPFDYQRFSVLLESTRGQNSFYISGLYDEYEYLTATLLDSEAAEIRVGYTRTLGSAWQVRLGGGFKKTDFSFSDRVDEDTGWELGLSRKFGRSLGVGLDYYFVDRESDAAGRNYRENVIRLAFSYTRQ